MVASWLKFQKIFESVNYFPKILNLLHLSGH